MIVASAIYIANKMMGSETPWVSLKKRFYKVFLMVNCNILRAGPIPLQK